MKRAFNIGIAWGWVQLTKHKFFEYQLSLGKKLATEPFLLRLHWTSKTDHAGIRFEFSVYKLFFYELSVYDHRHWDYDVEDWVDDKEGVRCSSLSNSFDR